MPSHAHATLLYCIWFAKLVRESEEMAPRLKELREEIGTSKELGLYHLSSSVIYTKNEKQDLLMIEAVRLFVKKCIKSNMYHALTFCNA